MNHKLWKNRILMRDKFESNTALLSDNSMGIYVEKRPNGSLMVHFKPLNEVFKVELFNDNTGVLINFERDLIDEDDIEYALDVFALFNKYPQFVLSASEEVYQINQIIDLLKAEYLNEISSYVMFKSVLKVFLLHLIRYQNNGFLEQDLNQKRVFEFLELMETHFLIETSTDYYANKIGVSNKRLNQILKEKLNLTAKQVIQQRQITEAKRQLVKSEITTKELAFKLGFDSGSSFSRFFKKNVGVSPSNFKTKV
ncbi:helix-turn-helix domain-containing protein [Winogradskyella endarachnes]|uniref:Helix-turn-helix domain-containing protein n=1 Tax=Winogradskyella endarachnes TaxID=2681965 RepID=A0A6L6UC27_9FLAO|nr:helix-turn-helix domain-containing protein [Winogradskyella endarachnes]MUU79783.1 helix-turn-helix domain-containing protein [Winogradskyella endarachnes]